MGPSADRPSLAWLIEETHPSGTASPSSREEVAAPGKYPPVSALRKPKDGAATSTTSSQSPPSVSYTPAVLGLLLRLQGVRLEAHPIHARTYVVLEHGMRVGEITFSAYEKQHTGRGWRIKDPASGVGPRYRSRWGAAWALIREVRD